jgi:hypothetical protein
MINYGRDSGKITAIGARNVSISKLTVDFLGWLGFSRHGTGLIVDCPEKCRSAHVLLYPFEKFAS